jgi:hypothetical protein
MPGYARALVIPRHEEDRRPSIGHPHQGCDRHFHKRRGDLASVEQVATVNDQVYLPSHCRLERPFEVGEEIVTPASPCNARAERQVNTKVGIGQQQYPNLPWPCEIA